MHIKKASRRLLDDLYESQRKSIRMLRHSHSHSKDYDDRDRK